MKTAFTGHRPDKLGGYGIETSKKLVFFAREILKEYGVEHAIVGMALGWDISVAHACVLEGIPFTAAIPFEGQEIKWNQHDQKRYHMILAKAAEKVYVCMPGYAAWKLQRRNEWMVDNSESLIALWDGSYGGTANCITYCNSKGRDEINVWDKWVNYIEYMGV